MRYLIVDAEINGTGIRDKYESGFVSLEDLGLTIHLINRIKNWLLSYENEHFSGYLNNNIIDELDLEGKSIAEAIKYELVDVRLEYFSDARMTSLLI